MKFIKINNRDVLDWATIAKLALGSIMDAIENNHDNVAYRLELNGEEFISYLRITKTENIIINIYKEDN